MDKKKIAEALIALSLPRPAELAGLMSCSPSMVSKIAKGERKVASEQDAAAVIQRFEELVSQILSLLADDPANEDIIPVDLVAEIGPDGEPACKWEVVTAKPTYYAITDTESVAVALFKKKYMAREWVALQDKKEF